MSIPTTGLWSLMIGTFIRAGRKKTEQVETDRSGNLYSMNQNNHINIVSENCITIRVDKPEM
jgi:hypothetical protein